MAAGGLFSTPRPEPGHLLPALGGLVLIVMLIGFTVMQHAFAGGGATTGVVSDVERRALALTGGRALGVRARPGLRAGARTQARG